jgi:hypothetical protein
MTHHRLWCSQYCQRKNDLSAIPSARSDVEKCDGLDAVIRTTQHGADHAAWGGPRSMGRTTQHGADHAAWGGSRSSRSAANDLRVASDQTQSTPYLSRTDRNAVTAQTVGVEPPRSSAAAVLVIGVPRSNALKLNGRVLFAWPQPVEHDASVRPVHFLARCPQTPATPVPSVSGGIGSCAAMDDAYSLFRPSCTSMPDDGMRGDWMRGDWMRGDWGRSWPELRTLSS